MKNVKNGMQGQLEVIAAQLADYVNLLQLAQDHSVQQGNLQTANWLLDQKMLVHNQISLLVGDVAFDEMIADKARALLVFDATRCTWNAVQQRPCAEQVAEHATVRKGTFDNTPLTRFSVTPFR